MSRNSWTEKLVGGSAIVLLALFAAGQADAQGRGGGAGAMGPAVSGGGAGFGSAGISSWPAAAHTHMPDRLPADTAFGQKGAETSAAKSSNASTAKDQGMAKAGAAIANAGNGGSTDKGRGGEHDTNGRAKAASVLGHGAESAATSNASNASGETGQTSSSAGVDANSTRNGLDGLSKAGQHADSHAASALQKGVEHQRTSNSLTDSTSD